MSTPLPFDLDTIVDLLRTLICPPPPLEHFWQIAFTAQLTAINAPS